MLEVEDIPSLQHACNTDSNMMEETPEQVAASKVLNIAELLEAVLLQLPCKDVVLAQRVSKAWKATIEKSVGLQTALCFKPAEARTSGDRITTREPITSDATSARDCYNDTLEEATTLINPLFRHLHQRYAPNEFVRLHGIYVEYNKAFRNILSEGKNASLREMRIMQPPVKSINIQFIKESLSVDAIYHFFVDNVQAENGIKVADVLEHLEKDARVTEDSNVYFSVRRREEKQVEVVYLDTPRL